MEVQSDKKKKGTRVTHCRITHDGCSTASCIGFVRPFFFYSTPMAMCALLDAQFYGSSCSPASGCCVYSPHSMELKDSPITEDSAANADSSSSEPRLHILYPFGQPKAHSLRA